MALLICAKVHDLEWPRTVKMHIQSPITKGKSLRAHVRARPTNLLFYHFSQLLDCLKAVLSWKYKIKCCSALNITAWIVRGEPDKCFIVVVLQRRKHLRRVQGVPGGAEARRQSSMGAGWRVSHDVSNWHSVLSVRQADMWAAVRSMVVLHNQDEPYCRRTRRLQAYPVSYSKPSSGRIACLGFIGRCTPSFNCKWNACETGA